MSSSSKPSSPKSSVRRKTVARLSPNHLDSRQLVKVKKEPPEDEIKEYAATAMSELLGWYGYEKVDSRCTRGLNLDHFASSSSPKTYQCLAADLRSKSNSLSPGLHQARGSKSPQSRTSRSPPTSSISIVSSRDDTAQISPALSLRTAAASPRVLENSDSASDTPDSSTTCSWCGRTGGTWEPGSASLPCGVSSNSGRFCSEVCFAAGRRAAFKKARTCDWCRHVRHSVSYVDFQDGESQLQFCSDKCLNQYKMNIFCRETQAHLAMHGLSTITSSNTSSGGLITPELWLRDCRSPPQSPDRADETLIVDDEPSNWPTNCNDTIEERPSINELYRNDKNPLPVAKNTSENDAKNLINSEEKENDRFRVETEEAIKESLKDEEYRRIQEQKNETEAFKSFSTVASVKIHRKERRKSPENSKEPLDNCSREGTIYLKDVRSLLGRETGGKTIRHVPAHRSRRISKSPTWLPESPMTFQPPVRGFPVHRPFVRHPMPLKFTPRPGNIPGPPPVAMRPPGQQEKISPAHSTNSQSSILPPVTVLVPYPIPIPIPLPIPIPIPFFSKFFNFDKRPETCEKTNDTASSAQMSSATPEDLSQRNKSINSVSKSISQQNLPMSNDKSPSDSSTSSSESATIKPQSAPVLSPASRTTRPLRKRRRQSTAPDDSEIRLKRRSKFVPV